LAIVLLISLPFFVFFRFGGMPRAKGLFRAKVSYIVKRCKGNTGSVIYLHKCILFRNKEKYKKNKKTELREKNFI
ncbi:hypothetical protein, partial [Acinetobacter baumannii]|uniref:hypothetical protein n=1 Tax=Acinetobacter baumannii TaxID=470 RepID=UPI003AFB795D